MCRMSFLWLMYSVTVFNYAFSLLLDNTESIYVSKSEFNALKSEVSALRADLTKGKMIKGYNNAYVLSNLLHLKGQKL